MTSSKGLEFDVVLIMGVDEKWIPDFRSFNDQALLNEDRRKLREEPTPRHVRTMPAHRS